MKSMFIPYISEYEITEIIKSLKYSSAGCELKWIHYISHIKNQISKEMGIIVLKMIVLLQL